MYNLLSILHLGIHLTNHCLFYCCSAAWS